MLEVCTCDDEDSEEEEEEEEAAQVDEVVDHRKDENAEQCSKRLKLTSVVWYTAAKRLGSGQALCLLCDKVFAVGDVRKHVVKSPSGRKE